MTADQTPHHRAIPRETLPFDRVALVLQGGGVREGHYAGVRRIATEARFTARPGNPPYGPSLYHP